MRKIMRKLLLLTIVCGTLLSGCGSSKDSATADKEFQQMDIGCLEQAGDLLKLKKYTEDEYACIVRAKDSSGELLVFRSSDGGRSFQKDDLEWMKDMEFCQDSCALTSIDRTADNGYLVTYDILNDSYERVETKVQYITKESVTDIADYKNSSNLITSKLVGDNIVVMEQDHITLFDRNGTKQAEIKQEGVMDLCEDGDNLLLVCEDGLMEYDLQGKCIKQYSEKMDVLTDKLRAVQEKINAEQLQKDIVWCDADGMVYLLLKDGIYRYYLENGVVEQLISDDRNLFAVGEVEGFLVTEKKEIYIAGRENTDGDVLFAGFFYQEKIPYFTMKQDGTISYSNTTDAKQKKDGSLKVYSLENSDYIDQAIKRFAQQFPDVDIVYEVGMDKENGLTTQDAVNAFHTQMLSGDGPDIIFMDGLNPDTYVQNGELLDLNEIVEQAGEDCFDAVVNAFEQEGAVYALPTRFAIPMIFASKEQVEQLKNPKELCAHLKTSGSGINDLFVYDGQALYDTLFPLYAKDILAGQKIEEEKMQQFVQEAKDIYEACNAHNNEVDVTVQKEAPRQFDSFDGLNVIPGINNYTGRPIDVWPDLTVGQLRSQVGVMHLYTARDYMQLSGKNYVFNTMSDVYLPKMIVSINKECKNKKMAKEFVQYLLSEDVINCENDNYIAQSFGDYEQVGISVNKKVREADADKYRNVQSTIASNSDNGMGSKITLHSDVTENEAEALEKCYSNAKACVYLDRIAEDIIVKYLDEVVSGNCTVEEAAGKICDELGMYMEE